MHVLADLTWHVAGLTCVFWQVWQALAGLCLFCLHGQLPAKSFPGSHQTKASGKQPKCSVDDFEGLHIEVKPINRDNKKGIYWDKASK